MLNKAMLKNAIPWSLNSGSLRVSVRPPSGIRQTSKRTVSKAIRKIRINSSTVYSLQNCNKY